VARGKEVTVVVELKARFDEETNINWSERLEQIGAQVVYGVVGLKTHAKLMLISRREGVHIRRYAHLSTGNYNPRTARLYTDLSMLTSDPKITADIEAVFNLLANQTKLPRLNKLVVSPFQLQRQLISQIQSTAKVARSGLEARIILKMNALTDEKLMSALVQASLDGVKIDLIVRGACMLPAQVKGFTDNVKVRSIVGRFLEHSRVLYFRADGIETLWLSSADWMNRNMLRRIEITWPVEDPLLRQRIVDECLVAYLHDTSDTWEMQSDGNYFSIRQLQKKTKGSSKEPQRSAQLALMTKYQSQT
jgi:polyphosphate kinase